MLNKQEKILLYGSNLWYLGEGMLGPLFAVFANKIGGDILEIAWAWATYLAIRGLLTILIGRLSDKYFSKERLMVLGYGLNTIFTFAYLAVSDQFGLFVVQVGLGVAAAFATPAWQALYAKHESKNSAGYAWGLVGGQADLMIAMATLIGGFIVSFFSFKILFLVMGMIQIAATLYQAKILIKPKG